MKTQRKKLTHNKAEILLVEDSHTQAEQIRHLLESQYYKVSVTQNGKQAMDWLSKHKPALVISDIVMPEMNGFELCKKIKFNKNTEDIPVILLTRLVDPEEIIEGLSCGADSFITKPYNEEYLLSHIERILSGENVMYNEKVPFSAQILFKGKKRFIQAEQQNIIRLMLDIYEGAIIQNERLVQTQEELRLLNERLESIVEERTSDLTAEIRLSNQIAERLKESEEKWRTLVTTIPEYIGLVDCDGKFLFLNHYAEGFSEKDTIGKSHLDFIPNEWKEFYRLKFEKCINTQKNQIFEYTAFGDNNTLRTYETCLVPIIDHEKVSNVMAIARDITERKLAEEKLQEREEHYRILFDEALDGICLADAETGLIIDCNQALSFLVVRERVELIGQPQTILHPPNTHEAAFSPTFEQHLTDKEGKTLETQIVTSTGIIREVEIKANYMNIRGRKMLQGVFHDITERKRAVEALRESEEKYRRIFENVQDLYYESSMEGIILDLSPSISILSEGQYRREDLIGKSMYEYYSESSERQALLAVLQERGAITDFEITLKNRDGSHIPCSISSKIIFDAQGRPEKIIGSMRNITDRKRAEETIIHERTMLRTLIDNLPDHIYVKDSEGRKVISNIADFKDFGFQSEDQVLGKTDLEILPFPIGRRGYNYEMEVLSSGKSIIGHEEDFIYPDGKKHWSLSTMIPLIDNTGKITGLVGIGHDITERKRAEEELIKAKKKAEESDRLKTAFLHNISHEIRTPMNAIVGFSTLLGEPDVDIQSRQSYIEVIMQSSNLCCRLLPIL
jgi:PAS domain S-box-containing protein